MPCPTELRVILGVEGADVLPKMLPAVRCYLSGKTTENYIQLFSQLPGVCALEHLHDVPMCAAISLTDFELAMHAAVRRLSDKTLLLYCLFHHVQAVTQKAKQRLGLHPNHRSADYRLLLHCVRSIYSAPTEAEYLAEVQKFRVLLIGEDDDDDLLRESDDEGDDDDEDANCDDDDESSEANAAVGAADDDDMIVDPPPPCFSNEVAKRGRTFCSTWSAPGMVSKLPFITGTGPRVAAVLKPSKK